MLASRLCLRAAARPQALSIPTTCSVGLRASKPVIWPSKRVFVSASRHRKDDAAARTLEGEMQAKQPSKESVKPETMEKAAPAEPTKNEPLLAEQTKSNKEQRKADWRIIRDMSQYLWPKDDLGVRFRVGLSVALLVGAKVRMSTTLSSHL